MSFGGPFRATEQEHRDGERYHGLPQDFFRCRQSARMALNQLFVVVYPTNSAEQQSNDQHDPHETIIQVRPNQRAGSDSHQNERAAHGRRAGFLLVRLRPVITYRLSDLQHAEPANHHWTDQQ